MAKRIQLLFGIAATAAFLMGLAIYLAQDRKAMVTKQLEKNLHNASWSRERDLESAPRANFSEETFSVGTINPFDKRLWQIRVDNQGRQTLKVALHSLRSNCVTAKIVNEKIPS